MAVKESREILTVENDDIGDHVSDTGTRLELLERGWRMFVEVDAEGKIVDALYWFPPGRGPGAGKQNEDGSVTVQPTSLRPVGQAD